MLKLIKAKKFDDLKKAISKFDFTPVADQTLCEAFVISGFWGDISLIDKLHRWGCPINSVWSTKTILHTAVTYPNPEVVSHIINLGADVNAREYFGQTPLITLCSFSPKFVDTEAETLYIESARRLIKSGADVDASDGSSMTALDYAGRGYCEKLVRLLISKGATLGACDSHGFWVINAALNLPGNDLLKLLLKAGLSPNYEFDKNRPMIQHAAERGWLDKARFLVKSGAQSKLPDGRDALKLAEECAQGLDEIKHSLGLE